MSTPPPPHTPPPAPSPATLTRNLFSGFSAASPVDADEFFQFAEEINIISGVNAPLESFVVKCPVECLEKGNVIAVFYDPTGGGGSFRDFILHGFAQLVEDTPQIFEFHILTSPTITVVYPPVMKLVHTKKVFAFNGFALKAMPDGIVARCSIRPPVPVQMSRDQTSQKGSASVVPQLLQGKGDSLKALQNADRIHNAKVLLRHDARLILEYFGPLDDMTGQRVKSAVLGMMLQTSTELVMMQPQNIPIFLGFFFQRTAAPPKDLSSVVTGLHVSHFAKFGMQITKHFQIIICVENLVKVLRAFVGGDCDGFVTDTFADMLFKLQSSEEDGLRFMDPSIVLDAVSVALTKWSGQLSSPRAATAGKDELRFLLSSALEIDVEEVGRQDNRRFKRKLESTAAMVSRDSKAPRGVDKKSRDAGPVSAPGKVNYCVAAVAFTLLGAKVFDGRPQLTACPLHKTGRCVFEHTLPAVPVSSNELADLVRTVGVITAPQKEKKAALLKVMNASTFSR